MDENKQAPSYGWESGKPVSLLARLKQDLKRAMLNKDAAGRDAIRQIMGEFPRLTVPIVLESGKKTTRCKGADEISDDDIIGIIRGLVKSEKTVLEIRGRDSSPYLEILEAYLPRMATREEIKAWIEANVDVTQFKNVMQAMGPVMKHFGRQADGRLVKEVLRDMAS
ncbi:MAG: GatB/YqeY domain-containing protein [Desulfobacterales bacterium]|nr:GatB/YqeY domain-containing protein [Desulfobacterales bacterium]